jgi:hypothetical protein
MRKFRGNNIIRTVYPTPHSPLPTPFFLLHFSFFILFAFSCQTNPKVPGPVLGEANSLPLETGAFAYIIADVQNAMPILNQTSIFKMKTKQLQQMLDKTTSAVIAMYLPPSEKHFRLVSWGNYPVFRAKMALGFSLDWKKQRSNTSGAPYWYSAKEGLSVALDQGQAWVLSTAGNIPAEPFSATGDGLSEVLLPEGFNDFSRGAILSCWLYEPGPLINRKLLEMGFPIEIPAELVLVSIYPAGTAQYEAFLRIQVPSASQARAIVAVFSLAKVFFSLPTSDESGDSAANKSNLEILQTIFFTNPPVQDDKNINIKTGILSSSGVALLFDIFSLQ